MRYVRGVRVFDAAQTTIGYRAQLPAVTVLIAGPTEAVTAALCDDQPVRRVETLSAAREALPQATVVLVTDRFEPGADTLLGVVRSGVHCRSETPVVRLAHGPVDGRAELDDPPRRQSDFDAVVTDEDTAAIRSVLTLGDRAETYRGAVEDLYEACRARASGEESGADVDEAFERATRAFEAVRDAAGRTPYEQLLGRSDEAYDPSQEPTRESNTEGEGVTGDEAR